MALLNWMYTNPWGKLEIGKCRYGLMLDENGMVFDDGVTTRLGEHHFMMTTTTGGARAVLDGTLAADRMAAAESPAGLGDRSLGHLRGRRSESRAVLRKVCGDIDFSNEAFPS